LAMRSIERRVTGSLDIALAPVRKTRFGSGVVREFLRINRSQSGRPWLARGAHGGRAQPRRSPIFCADRRRRPTI
jgi:hypothetical protein